MSGDWGIELVPVVVDARHFTSITGLTTGLDNLGLEYIVRMSLDGIIRQRRAVRDMSGRGFGVAGVVQQYQDSFVGQLAAVQGGLGVGELVGDLVGPVHCQRGLTGARFVASLSGYEHAW
jgi:hypothetical protein